MLAALEPIAARYGVPVEVVDVDSDPALEAVHGERVPVLVADGTELCHYHLDAGRVITALDAYRSRGSAEHAGEPVDESAHSLADQPANPDSGQRRPDFG
jgi:hypothetical protein